MSIKHYTLYSNFFLGNPKVLGIEKAKDYYRIVKNLNLKSSKEDIGSPCY